MAEEVDDPRPPHSPVPPRGQRFLAGYVWLVLRNITGWLLILASFVAGPLVPGPGGIPLFLVGFALVSFPGKRRLTARVLRGRPVRLRPRRFAFVSLALALAAPAVVLAVAGSRSTLLGRVYDRGVVAVAGLYGVGVAVTWLAARLSPRVLNLLLRMAARGRRRFRPWLRRHRIRLLPPRWRRRHAHEPGAGPFRLKEEILGFRRRGKQS